VADVVGVVDAGVDRVRRELRAMLDVQEAELRRLFAEMRTEGGRLRPTARQVAQAKAIGDRLADEYERIGGELRGSYRRLAGEVVAEVGRELAEWDIPPELSGPAVTSLQAQLGNTLDGLSIIAREGADDLRRAVLQMTQTSVSPDAALDALKGKLGLTESRALSLVDTSVSALDRTVSLVQASDVGLSLFLYDGPDDSLTRPFCAEHVGKVHTQEEVAQLTNDTGPNPAASYGGGWNCRHRWVAVDEQEARDYPRWGG